MSSSTRCVAHRSPTNHNSRRWIDFSSLDTLMQNVVVTSYNSHVASLTPGMTQCCIHGQIPCPWDIQHLQNRHCVITILFDVTCHDASCVGGDTIISFTRVYVLYICNCWTRLFPVTKRKQCILGNILELLAVSSHLLDHCILKKETWVHKSYQLLCGSYMLPYLYKNSTYRNIQYTINNFLQSAFTL